MIPRPNPISKHPAGITDVVGCFWRHRELVMQMARREIIGRYKGSALGLLWSFFNPIFMLSVYTFVFGTVFKAKWGADDGGDHAQFALILFTGMIVHSFFAEALNRAPTLIVSNPNYVKKVIFPLETLPWIALTSALFHTSVSIGVLLSFYLAIHHALHWTIVFLPIIFAPLVLVAAGFTWLLAATGVFLRDVAQTTGLVTTALMFLSPVFYPATSLPEKLRPFLQANPITFIMEQAREVIIWGRQPDWFHLGLYAAASVVVAWAGLYWFQRTRKGFADVL